MYQNLSYKNRGQINISNLTRVEREVYNLVKQAGGVGESATSVAKKLGGTRQNAYIKLNRLLKAGLLKKIDKNYIINDENINKYFYESNEYLQKPSEYREIVNFEFDSDNCVNKLAKNR